MFFSIFLIKTQTIYTKHISSLSRCSRNFIFEKNTCTNFFNLMCIICLTDSCFFHYSSDSSPSEGETTPNSGIKNKHRKDDEEEEEEDSDADKHEVKRLKFDEKEEDETGSEEKESSCCKGSGSSSETLESSKDSCSQEDDSGTPCDTPATSEDRGKCLTHPHSG